MSEEPVAPPPRSPHVPNEEVIREFNDRGTLWLLEDPLQLRDLLQILEPELAGKQKAEGRRQKDEAASRAPGGARGMRSGRRMSHDVFPSAF